MGPKLWSATIALAALAAAQEQPSLVVYPLANRVDNGWQANIWQVIRQIGIWRHSNNIRGVMAGQEHFIRQA